MKHFQSMLVLQNWYPAAIVAIVVALAVWLLSRSRISEGFFGRIASGFVVFALLGSALVTVYHMSNGRLTEKFPLTSLLILVALASFLLLLLYIANSFAGYGALDK